MKSKLLTLLLALFTCLFLSGCDGETDDGEGGLPWSRPADWQGRMPGIGCGGSKAPGTL